MCPRVERFESRIKTVVGRMCSRSPFFCRPALYVSFKAVFQTLPVFLELLSAPGTSRCRSLSPSVSGGISRERWVCPMPESMAESMTIPLIHGPVRSGREFGLTSMPLG